MRNHAEEPRGADAQRGADEHGVVAAPKLRRPLRPSNDLLDALLPDVARHALGVRQHRLRCDLSRLALAIGLVAE
eukprot:29337-Pelagococcus_subviridis.AAC.7